MKTELKDSHQLEIRRSITIAKPESELIACWSNAENLVCFMNEVIHVTPIGTDEVQFKIPGVLGMDMAWTARLFKENHSLSWQSTGNSKEARELNVHFAMAPGNQGTETVLIFRFNPPGGVVGEALTNAIGMAPNLMVGKILRRFKALAETGEISTLQYNASNRKEAEQAGEQK